jgi:hypothetical protein
MRQRALIDQLGSAQLTQINVAQRVVIALFGAMVSLRLKFLLCFAWIGFARAFVSSAKAQVILIPGGDYESEFEKFLVVIISLVLLLVAARYSYRSGQLDFALDWFAE